MIYMDYFDLETCIQYLNSILRPLCQKYYCPCFPIDWL